MQIIESVLEMQSQAISLRTKNRLIGLVPTMGALHEGHLALVRRGSELGPVVVSIFVNPTQFGPSEDFLTYPSTPKEDLEKLEEMGVDLLFMPSVDEMYPGDHGHHERTMVQVPDLSDILCGAYRPGHFTGVATVVNKLFNIVQPDVAVFGTKDFQQLAVIRRMTRDLNLPHEIVGMPIYREPDGLAMSSRNGYLSARERAIAPVLYRVLSGVVQRLREGSDDYAGLQAQTARELDENGLRTDYIAIRRADDLLEPGAGESRLVVLAAAYLGKARLIDNIDLVR